MGCIPLTAGMLARGPLVVRVAAGARIVTQAGVEILREPVGMAPRPPRELADAVRDGGRELVRSGVVHRPEPPAAKCVHLGERRTRKVLCVTCQGANNIDQPVHECAVHKRCLPQFRPKGEAADRWYGNAELGIEPREESKMYHVCQGCLSRQVLDEIKPPGE
jgi:hypothetical protein